MKHLNSIYISISFILITCTNLKAQETYLSTIKDSTIWCYYVHDTWKNRYEYYRYIVDGDTIISNHAYKKIYKYTTDLYDKKQAKYVTGIRKENRKIYCPHDFYYGDNLPQEKNERILYDFSLEEGNTFGNEQLKFKVKYTETLQIGDTLRKKIYFDPFTWIEDLGILNEDLFNPLYSITLGSEQTHLDMFIENKKIIYGDPGFSFFTEGNHWTERSTAFNDKNKYQLNHYRIQGDTLIQGKSYLKLYKNHLYQGGLRENIEHKIFYYEEGKPEILLYDFHWGPSKILQLTNFSNKEFDVVIFIIGGQLKEMELEDGKTYHYCDLPENPNPDGQPFLTLNPQVKLIRNIGLTAGIFKMAETKQQEPTYYTDLVSFYNSEGELIYQNPAFNEQGRLLAIGQVRTGKKLSVQKQGNRITFTLSGPVIESQAELRIYRIDGKEISTCSMKAGAITIDNLQSGLYLYRLNGANAKPETGKFIIGN